MWTEEAERLRERPGRGQDLEVLKRLTAPHQPLARWRSRLTPACGERSTDLAQRASPIVSLRRSPRPSGAGSRRCGSGAGSAKLAGVLLRSFPRKRESIWACGALRLEEQKTLGKLNNCRHRIGRPSGTDIEPPQFEA